MIKSWKKRGRHQKKRQKAIQNAPHAPKTQRPIPQSGHSATQAYKKTPKLLIIGIIVFAISALGAILLLRIWHPKIAIVCICLFVLSLMAFIMAKISLPPETTKKIVILYTVCSIVVMIIGWIIGPLIFDIIEHGLGTTVSPPQIESTATESPSSDIPQLQTDNLQEAAYTVLTIGSTGPAVENLVAELRKQGFYTGSDTNRYTASVVDAVQAFQLANDLEVDGIADSKTQHALFKTVPLGTNSLKMDFFPAEICDWNTGIIDELWPIGTNMKVYDVKSHIVWLAHRTGGDYHVDAEPLTADDTARLCRSFGVTDVEEISDFMLYQRRPLLITVGTQTFACSMYGIPHSGQMVDAITDNNFKGQICIHFTNSKTHNDHIDSSHQAAIEYALKNAPNGYK